MQTSPAPTPPWLASTTLEKILEHRFLFEIGAELWHAGIRDFEVLRSEVDAFGHDIVIEANGVMRHIQLKMMAEGGKRARVDISRRLAERPSGCVVWGVYSPDTLIPVRWRWFGGLPGAPLPELGGRIARHSRAGADGVKKERSGLRTLPASRFDTLPSTAVLVARLFGRLPADADDTAILLRHLDHPSREPAPPRLAAVRSGDLSPVADDLCWDRSAEVAHLIDGYELAEQLGRGDAVALAHALKEGAMQGGAWPGSLAELWVALFVEHRGWRMSPVGPDREQVQLLDRLCRQLSEAAARALV